MTDNVLPEKTRNGLTWRRLRNPLRAPARVVRNVPYWWNDTISEEEHIFVLGPPRSGTTLAKTVLQAHTSICGVDGETWFFLCKDYSTIVPDKKITGLHIIQNLSEEARANHCKRR